MQCSLYGDKSTFLGPHVECAKHGKCRMTCTSPCNTKKIAECCAENHSNQNNIMEKEIRKSLDFDPIAKAEEITGSKDINVMGGVALSIMHEQAQEKKGMMILNQDSWFAMPLKDYIRVIESIGFKKVLHEDIGGDYLSIWWHEDGILLKFDTYYGSLNGGDFYFNYQGPYKAMHRCSNRRFRGNNDDPDVWIANRDCREGIRFAIDSMKKEGVFLKKWIERPFLWLLSWKDTKVKGYNYDQINAERIAKLPKEIQEAITP